MLPGHPHVPAWASGHWKALISVPKSRWTVPQRALAFVPLPSTGMTLPDSLPAEVRTIPIRAPGNNMPITLAVLTY